MRSHCALYVDAGYLLASAATRVTGTSLRSGIHVEYRPLIRGLIDQVESRAGLPLLRLHWYDSARDGVPDPQQERIGALPQVKLRLGRFGMDGQQKGVDLRIGLDLVNHARNRTADVFFLLTGDDDLSEAVEEAQALGVQVIVLAVPNRNGTPQGVSRHLERAADSAVLVDEVTVDGAVIKVELPPPTVAPIPPVPAPDAMPSTPARTPTSVPTPASLASCEAHTGTTRSTVVYSTSTNGPAAGAPISEPGEVEHQIDVVAASVFSTFRESATLEGMTALRHAKPSIPRDIDRALLLDLSAALDVYDLSDPIRYRLRDRFWALVDSADNAANR